MEKNLVDGFLKTVYLKKKKGLLLDRIVWEVINKRRNPRVRRTS
jgi:hypothetical protein